MLKTGVLLVNLGTPNTPRKRDVFAYLNEFLLDKRVIDIPFLLRQLLVRLYIVPKRLLKSQESYKQIWGEKGSLLAVYSNEVRNLLAESLGEGYVVELAMRYQKPSIESALKKLKGLHRLIVLPLFPQYASATTGSVHEEVMRLVSSWNTIPELCLIRSYADHPKMIEAHCSIAKKHRLDTYDHVVLSFHGLPKRQIKKCDPYGVCLQNGCCESLNEFNASCYSAQCYQTARLLMEGLSLEKEKTSVTFQSRLGREPWLTPYTQETIVSLAEQGKKRVCVLCPSFVCDCLETIFEIEKEVEEEFVKAGGETLKLIPSLNTHPLWIEALKELTHSSTPQSVSIG